MEVKEEIQAVTKTETIKKMIFTVHFLAHYKVIFLAQVYQP